MKKGSNPPPPLGRKDRPKAPPAPPRLKKDGKVEKTNFFYFSKAQLRIRRNCSWYKKMEVKKKGEYIEYTEHCKNKKPSWEDAVLVKSAGEKYKLRLNGKKRK